MKIVQTIKDLFEFDWAWRIFIVLQLLGLLLLLYLDSTTRNWSIIPDLHDYRGNTRFAWDFLKDWHWTRYKTNWYAAACIFSPFLISKSLDWINSARKK